jgi:hypothetical protein
LECVAARPWFRPHAQHGLTPDPSKLQIRIETSEAKASITAREAMKSLTISVYRFKDQRVLSDGPCDSNAEVDRRLQALWVDLSASPFA